MATAKTATKKEKKEEKKIQASNLTELELLTLLKNNGYAAVRINREVSHTKRVFGGNIVCCILCIKGESVFLMDATERKISSGETLIIDSEFFIQTENCSSDFEAVAMVCTKFFLFPPTLHQEIDMHFFLLQHPILKVSAEKALQLQGIFEIIHEKQYAETQMNTFYNRTLSKNISWHLSKAFCFEMFEQYRNQLPFGRFGIKVSNKESIVMRFLYLLRDKIVTERNISFYAQALDITPQYLATVLKSITGLSTNQWMHMIIIEKAKHMLLTENMNINQVAQALNYPDQSTFGKMFKAETGMSPIRFKKEVDG